MGRTLQHNGAVIEPLTTKDVGSWYIVVVGSGEEEVGAVEELGSGEEGGVQDPFAEEDVLTRDDFDLDFDDLTLTLRLCLFT